MELLRNARATHLGEAFDLGNVGDGHQPRNNGDRDACRTCPAREGPVFVVVEEQLGDKEVRACVDLLNQVRQVLV